MTEPQAPEAPLRRTSLYESHVALGGRIVPFAGWEMPVQYTGIVDEHQAVRTAAGLFDVSPHGRARDARRVRRARSSNYLVTNDARSSPTARRSTPAPATRRGTILDDLIVYRARDRPLAHRLQRLEPREDGAGLRPGRRGPLRVRRPERRDGAHRAAGAARRSTCSTLAGSDAATLRAADELPLPRRGRREREVHRRPHRLHRRGRRRDLLRLERRPRALGRAPRRSASRSA